jgi:hypothetical protein
MFSHTRPSIFVWFFQNFKSSPNCLAWSILHYEWSKWSFQKKIVFHVLRHPSINFRQIFSKFQIFTKVPSMIYSTLLMIILEFSTQNNFSCFHTSVHQFSSDFFKILNLHQSAQHDLFYKTEDHYGVLIRK